MDGCISRQFLSLAFCPEELAHINGPVSELVGGLRFVDDLLACSASLCDECVGSIGAQHV